MGAFMIWDAYMPGVTSIKGYRYPPPYPIILRWREESRLAAD
jgi:hypothetical protein